MRYMRQYKKTRGDLLDRIPLWLDKLFDRVIHQADGLVVPGDKSPFS